MNFINKKTNKEKVLNFLPRLGRSWRAKGSQTFFRVLEFPCRIPNIKKLSSEHFNLCEEEISLDEIIKFRWNHKILKQIINLQLIMALQQNFKRVLLNCAPSSIHLHPALCNTLNVIRTKVSHIIWQFSKVWAEKFKFAHLTKNWHKWYFDGANSKSGLKFFQFRPKNPIFGQIWVGKF